MLARRSLALLLPLLALLLQPSSSRVVASGPVLFQRGVSSTRSVVLDDTPGAADENLSAAAASMDGPAAAAAAAGEAALVTTLPSEAGPNATTQALISDLYGDALEPVSHGGSAGDTKEDEDEDPSSEHGQGPEHNGSIAGGEGAATTGSEHGEHGATTHGSASHHDDGGHHFHRHVALLFFFGVLAIGSCITMFLERHFPAVPYSVALFAVGMLAALIHACKSKDSSLTWPSWYSSVDMWSHINPHLLFFSFLPALIFAKAMRLNSQLAATCIYQVLLLACPGVLLGTALTGCVGHFVLPYGWDWSVSLVFGTILSATDPVAVVALFNTLGVSPRLTMVISGEGLLNDGTAIVAFALMLKVALGASIDFWGVVGFFSQMTLVAVAVGGLVGGASVWLIGKCAEFGYRSDAMAQVILTICCGYLAFFIAESELSTSGVLATVSAGLAVAYKAWPRFVSRETMHIVWETVEFIGNTVIFFLAGVIFADILTSRRHLIGPADFAWLLVVYASAMAIRAIMVCTFWPLLNAVGVPISRQEAVVVVWSGLRGAVSLALAIIVDLEPGISEQMGARIMFHVGGVAALTFLVNASFAGAVLRAIGLTRSSRAREEVLSRLAQHVAAKASEACERECASAADIRFRGANRELVRAMLPDLKAGMADDEPDSDSEEQALISIYRETWLRVVQQHYWAAIDQGILPRTLEVARILLNSTDIALESSDTGLRDWEAVAREVHMRPPGPLWRTICALAEYRPLCWLPDIRSTCSEEGWAMQKVYIALSFQEAHVHAESAVPEHMGSSGRWNDGITQQVCRESCEQRARAAELLEQIPKRFVELGKSEMLARKLLHTQRESLAELREQGFLTASEASHMEHQVLEAQRHIVNAPKDSWVPRHEVDSDSRLFLGPS